MVKWSAIIMWIYIQTNWNQTPLILYSEHEILIWPQFQITHFNCTYCILQSPNPSQKNPIVSDPCYWHKPVVMWTIFLGNCIQFEREWTKWKVIKSIDVCWLLMSTLTYDLLFLLRICGHLILTLRSEDGSGLKQNKTVCICLLFVWILFH